VGEETVRVNVLITKEQRRRLFHVLLDEDISFSEWTRRQIDTYLEKRGPKGKGRKKVKSPIVMPPVPRPDLVPMVERRRKKREG